MSIRDRLKAGIAAFIQGNTGSVKNHVTPFGTGSVGLSGMMNPFSLKQLQTMRPYDRRECVKNSRLLDNKLAICGALNDGSIRYAIGSGISDYANTGDPEFDNAADRYTESVFQSEKFDLTEEQTWPELVALIARTVLVDGDAGIGKVLRVDAKGRPTHGPQIQLFTTEQIGDGNGGNLQPGESMVEGIGRDQFGAPSKYRILKEDGGYVDLAKDNFVLVKDKKRIALNRGIPWCHRATKEGFSILELSDLEQAAAYLNAVFAAIITTPDGEIPDSIEDMLMQKIGADSPARKNTVVSMIGGAKVPVFPAGTKLEAYQSNRPSATWSGHMDYLVSLLAASYGVPVNFIWAIVGRKGPEVRMTLTQAQWYFNYIVILMIRRCVKPIRDWVLRYGILTGQVNDGRLPRNGAHYSLARYHGPRDITIDERYYHKTWLDRLAAGLGTEEEYYSLLGQEGTTQSRRRIDEIAATKEYCKKKGVLYLGEFKEVKPGQIPANNTSEPTALGS